MSSAAQKFYAIRKGLESCICLSWEECRLRTNGVKGATLKSFLTEKEARAWIQAQGSVFSKDQKIPVVGVPKEKALNEASRSLCKVRDWKQSISQDRWLKQQFYSIENTRKGVHETLPLLLEKVKEQAQKGGEEGLLEQEVFPFCEEADKKESTCFIFTDGSCPLNPGPCSSAFCAIERHQEKEKESRLAVTFGNQYWRSETFPWKNSTNNVGEVGAVLVALHHLRLSKKSHSRITFFLDSQISINWILFMFRSPAQLKLHCPMYRLNQDILEDLFHEFEAYMNLYKGCNFQFRKVKAHSNILLNECVDQLALSIFPSSIWKRAHAQ